MHALQYFKVSIMRIVSVGALQGIPTSKYQESLTKGFLTFRKLTSFTPTELGRLYLLYERPVVSEVIHETERFRKF